MPSVWIENKLINKEIFFELARDKDFLESLNIKADSIEGYLFPETYYFNRSMSTRQIMKIMVNQFWKKVTPEMIKRAEELGFRYSSSLLPLLLLSAKNQVMMLKNL